MPEFDKNAEFIWAIFALGVAIPLMMALFAGLRARLARQRLERLKQEDSLD